MPEYSALRVHLVPYMVPVALEAGSRPKAAAAAELQLRLVPMARDSAKVLVLAVAAASAVELGNDIAFLFQPAFIARLAPL